MRSGRRYPRAPGLGWLAAALRPWLAGLDREVETGLAALTFLESWLAGTPGTSEELYTAATTLRDGFDALELAQPPVLWELVRPLAARGRPASAVSGLPYRLVDRVELLSPQTANAAHPSPVPASD